MMDRQYATDIARLHVIAAETRLRAVESQLSLGLTFCAIAETEIRYGRLDQAIQVVNRLRHHAEVIGLHLDEPGHLPTLALPALRVRLAKLKERTEEIESHLQR